MREDSWLGERMGCPAWTVESGDSVDEVATRGPGFFQAKVASTDVGRVTELESGGFHVVDVNVTLNRDPGPTAGPSSPGVRDAQPSDREQVLAIAEHDYSVSRFHLDPAIPDSTARRIKRDWVANFFAGGRGDRLLVCERGGAAVGFVLVLDREDVSIIDLIAVEASARGKGAGTSLLSALIGSRPDCGVHVGTQISNLEALRFYERQGFVVSRTEYVLHRHV